MDDPRAGVKNDTGNETRPSGPRIPSRALLFHYMIASYDWLDRGGCFRSTINLIRNCWNRLLLIFGCA